MNAQRMVRGLLCLDEVEVPVVDWSDRVAELFTRPHHRKVEGDDGLYQAAVHPGELGVEALALLAVVVDLLHKLVDCLDQLDVVEGRGEVLAVRTVWCVAERRVLASLEESHFFYCGQGVLAVGGC